MGMSALLLVATIALLGPGLAGGCQYNAQTFRFPSSFVTAKEPFVFPLSQTTFPANLAFAVQYAKSYKIIRNFRDSTVYVAYQCGSVKPSVGGNIPENARFVRIPLMSYAMDTDIPVVFLRMLGVLGRMSQGSEYTVDACGQKRLDEIRARGRNPIFSSSKNFPGTVISADPWSATPNNFVTFAPGRDAGPLQRANWLKYLALFFNKENRAMETMNAVTNVYNCVKSKATAGVNTKPVVAWLSYYLNTWTLSAAQYKLQFVEDAGGRDVSAVAPTTVSSFNMSTTAGRDGLRRLLARLDFVLDESWLEDGPPGYSLTEFLNNAKITGVQAEKIRVLKNRNVWNIGGRFNSKFGIDWYEGAMAQPQVVLEDLVSIFRPRLVPSGRRTHFYRITNKKDGTIVRANDCTVPIAKELDPRQSVIAGC